MYRHLFLLLLMSMLVFPVFAQDSNNEHFVSTDGLFSFAYPAGWLAEGSADADGAIFASVTPEPFDAFNLSDLQPGQQAVIFLGFPATTLEGSASDLPPDQLAQMVVASLAADSDQALTLSQPTITTLANGIEAGQIDLQSDTGAGVIFVYRQSGYILLVAMIAHQDALSEFRPQALQIISSFAFNEEVINQQNVSPELSDLLSEDAPVRHVLVDLDMAHEDMIALLYLLNHSQIQVEAVTVTGTGEAHCAAGVSNAQGLLALSGQKGIPVACGRETPLVGDHAFPEPWREAADAAYGVALPAVDAPTETTAVDVITSVVSTSPVPVVLVALGPPTNLAEAIQASPQITHNIEAIYIMGGAIDVPGNVGPSGVGIDNRVAEWNIYIDPTAANIVLRSGVPVTLVALDATADVPINTEFYRRLGELHQSAEANFVYEILTANLDLIEADGLQFWDSLTAAIITDESLATFETHKLLVVEKEGSESGHTRLDDSGIAVRVATSADRQRFEALLLAVLNHQA